MIDKIKKALKLIKNTNKQGLTIIELVVVVGIGSALIIILVAMITSAFDISRREFEQGAITEKARKEIERMSDEIRNAQYVDCNLDSDTADSGEHWLIEGDDYSVTLYSNVDSDVEAEKIRYFIERDNPSEKKKLKRGVTQLGASLCDFSGTEDVQVVADKLNNVKGVNNSIPLFKYYAGNDNTSVVTAPVSTLSSVLRVGMEMHIEDSVNGQATIEISTDVVPRSVESPPACFDQGVQVKRYKYTSAINNFAGDAYNECQSYCMGASILPAGNCCAWSSSFSWQGNKDWYVWSSCQCEDTYLPPDLTPESVNVGGYTTFAKECLEGTKCGGQMGEPICDAGCLDGPGDCVCVCPAGWQDTTACNDGVDNDNDGTIDYNGGTGDPGCTSDSDSSENDPAIACDDGLDNDGDTFVDYQLWGGDPNCADSLDNIECGPVEIYGVPQCSDGVDNDCDGFIDFGSDNECMGPNWNNEMAITEQCGDGTDNDEDGEIDDAGGGMGEPADSDCVDQFDISEFNPNPPGPSYECSDDIDNDGDGGGASLLSGTQNIFVSGNYAYITSGVENALTIFDISNPLSPVFLSEVYDGDGQFNRLSQAYGVHIDGIYAYITSFVDNALSIIDISDPPNPLLLSEVYDGASGFNYLAGARGIHVSGDYAYITSSTDNSLSIADISAGIAPVLESEVYDGDGEFNQLAGARGVYVSGNYAYITSFTDSSLTIMDISNPADPALMSEVYDNDSEFSELSGASDVKVVPPYAYVTSATDGSLTIMDISDPGNPELESEVYDGDGQFNELSGAHAVDVVGNYAYVVSDIDGSLTIMDISDAMNPGLLSETVDGVGGALIDWDGGPLGEPADPDCVDMLDDSEATSYQCSNGIDDDDDGHIDYLGGPNQEPADPECGNEFDDDELNSF